MIHIGGAMSIKHHIILGILLTNLTSCSDSPLGFKDSESSSKQSEEVKVDKPLVTETDGENALQKQDVEKAPEEKEDIFPPVSDAMFAEFDPAEVFEPTELGYMHSDMIIDVKNITYWGKENKGLFAAQKSIVQNQYGLRSHPWPGGIIPIAGEKSTASEMAMILEGCNE